MYGTSASCKQPYYEPSETRWHKRPRGSPLLQPIDSNPWRVASPVLQERFALRLLRCVQLWVLGVALRQRKAVNCFREPDDGVVRRDLHSVGSAASVDSRLRCKRAAGVAHVSSLHGTHGFQDRVSDLLPHGRGPACLRKPCDLHEGHRARSCSVSCSSPTRALRV